MAAAPGLVRFASRYTVSIEDAEDAYQRAMEIALLRAPVTEQKPFIAWLHAVIKHEAIAVARARAREGPLHGEDLGASYAAVAAAPAGGPDAVAEWRERYRTVQDAMAALTESQRVCLMLKSAGASYAEIEGITGFSARKVERSVLEGRRRLQTLEIRLATGADCGPLRPALERVAQSEAGWSERRRVSRHLRHCNPCRARYRELRASSQTIAALVPVALLGGATLLKGPPDPSHLFSWWDRLAAAATVRTGQAVQQLAEVPSLLTSKAGVGAMAVAAAGAVGAPVVADAVRERGASTVRPVTAGVATTETGTTAAAAAGPDRRPVRIAPARPRATLGGTAARVRPHPRARPAAPQAHRPRRIAVPIQAARPAPTTTVHRQAARRRTPGVVHARRRPAAPPVRLTGPELEFAP